jgi:hypothetical protein
MFRIRQYRKGSRCVLPVPDGMVGAVPAALSPRFVRPGVAIGASVLLLVRFDRVPHDHATNAGAPA